MCGTQHSVRVVISRRLLELSNIESPVRSSPGTGGLPYRLSGHRNGSRSWVSRFRNGWLSGTDLVIIHPISNSHCDVRSRVVRERLKCVHFSVEKAAPFVAPRCDAEVRIFSFHMFVNKCNSSQQRIVDGSKNKYRSVI